MKKGKIRITDLTVKAIIGTNKWERKKRQTILINIEIEYDASRAIESDKLEYALDYKTLIKKIISKAGKTRFFLLEKLTDFILGLVLENKRVLSAVVRVDKPGALTGAKSVWFEMKR